MGTSLLHVIHLRMTILPLRYFLSILYFLPMNLRTCFGCLVAFNVFKSINIDAVTAIEQPLMLVFFTVDLALLLIIYIVYILIVNLHLVSLIIEFIYNYI